MKKILVTGACGYKGSVLVPKLLENGYEVTALDIMWFGNFLKPHKRLTIIESDIRCADWRILNDIDAIIHLASVANDPCGDLDPKLTWEINALATMQLADNAARFGVQQFVYASSGSVYGVKDEEQVIEELLLTPISGYNKSKMVAERILLSYSSQMHVQIIRPATVCGLSPRMRLDVSVNMLTMQALNNGLITVFGGDQARPNIHIDDITDLYVDMIVNKDRYNGIYNAGFENISIRNIATIVTALIPAEIKTLPSNDPRSYRINSDRLLATGFKPRKTIKNAISEIMAKYQNGELKDEERFYNIKWMRQGIS